MLSQYLSDQLATGEVGRHWSRVWRPLTQVES